MNKITVSTIVEATSQNAWDAYTQPEHIRRWNFASDDWHCPRASSDLRVGGTFSSRMEARDGSAGFDFEGTYTEVNPHTALAYQFGDRQASISFEPITPDQTRVTVRFDPEETHPEELQREGWQAILENYRKHAESLRG